jgi:hypothetical protein
VRAGVRKLKAGTRQLYRCDGCYRRFSNLNRHRKHTPPRAVLDALCLVCQSYPYRDIVHALHRKHKVEVSPGTISKWVKEYQPPYLEIIGMNRRYTPVIRGHLFTHHGLPYHYQVHLPKLNTCPLEGLKSYLLRLPEFIDHTMFDAKVDSSATTDAARGAQTPEPSPTASSRASQLTLARNPGLQVKTDSPISQLAAQALRFAPTNRDRHPVVEQYFLACDRNTIAVEVPVYFIHKVHGSITGHIDMLQFSFGKLWILDFKPGAENEDHEKVITQLSVYATALHYRSRVRLDEIRCAYFDERVFYAFKPEMV